MNEYLLAYLSMSSWTTNLYQQLLGGVDMSQGSAMSVGTYLDQNVSNAQQWNQTSGDLLANAAGMYQEINLVYKTLYSVDTKLKAEINRLEGGVKAYEAINKRLKSQSTLKYTPSARFDFDLSSSDWVDYSQEYYTLSSELDIKKSEQIIALGSAGGFSCIRSQGGFIGTVKIENVLGQVVNETDPSMAFDGSDTTQWMASAKTPSPIKIDPSAVLWLSSKYQQGAAVRLRIELERPMLVSELYIDPLTIDPMILDTLAYRPLDAINLLANPNFSLLTGDIIDSWTSYSSAFGVTGAGLDGSTAASLTYSGTISQTLPVNDYGMLDLHWLQKGSYGVLAGATITWILGTGATLTTTNKCFKLSSTWQNCKASIHIPTGVSSAIVQFGLQTPNDQATMWIDTAFVGVNTTQSELPQFTEDECRLSGPRTLMFDRPIFSDTFWLVFTQPHTRAGVWPVSTGTINNNRQMFEYEFGAKEIDLRYNEYLTNGRLVSIPFLTNNEIREIWIESSEKIEDQGGLSYYIAVKKQDPLEYPDVIELSSLSDPIPTNPKRIKIYTSEEKAAGWGPTTVNSQQIIQLNSKESAVILTLDPTPLEWTSQNGTDRFGKLLLPEISHTIMPRVVSIQTFLASSYPKAIDFDPNASKVLGMTMPSTSMSLASYYNVINSTAASRSDIERSLPSTIPASGMPITTSIKGYQPIKVWIDTPDWKASPDTFGVPEKSRVRFVRFEMLTANQLAAQRKVSTNDQNLFSVGSTTGKIPANTSTHQDLQIIKSGANKGNFSITLADGNTMMVTEREWSSFKRGTSSRSSTEKISERSINTYQTQYWPLVDGSKGGLVSSAGGNSLVRLWWYKAIPTPVVYPIGQGGYRVTDASLGLVEVLMAPPSTGCVLAADYWHASDKEGQEPYSWSLALTLPISGYTIDDGYKETLTAVSYPITRNMTDYVYGKIPVLKPPMFDAMQDDYYPVIEYYLNGNNELVFATEFFEYGDTPAKIKVEYETLKIAPRLFIDMTRAGRSTRSSTIDSISLCARERQQMLRVRGGL